MDSAATQAGQAPVSFIFFNLKLIAMMGGAIAAAGALTILGLVGLGGCFNKCVLFWLCVHSACRCRFPVFDDVL